MAEPTHRKIQIVGCVGPHRRAAVINARRTQLQLLLDDGTPDPDWANFPLKHGDYIDCGEWVERVFAEAGDGAASSA